MSNRVAFCNSSALITAGDLDFLSKATKLSPERVILLSEEKRDLWLLADQIADIDLGDKLILELSFSFFSLLTVLKFSKQSNFPIEDRGYIGETLGEVFPQIQPNKMPYKLTDVSENLSKYLMILIGIFGESLNRPRHIGVSKGYLLTQMEAGFRSSDHRSIAVNSREWIKILQSIKKEQFL